ncbi:PDDEXK nuclease domain-containing protein [Xenorhabdus sp. KJ12.1]|uniref:PDDEXK nuclease domain-containing protein n=1 Tax=Xenorhabdus sp. KJ12.1 TaxID=1851571 RepID=UPI001F4E76FA|nr:PDDEXK nuclease domain-containing protein [Xenorhabdus sp. KJ12.1]
MQSQTKDQILAEYALRGIQKPIGVSDYELTRSLPENLKSSLPNIRYFRVFFHSHLKNKAPDSALLIRYLVSTKGD